MTPNSKRTRGIRYIAAALDKYYKNRYVTYQERLERARELQSGFKKSGKTATIRSIKSIEKGLITRGRPSKEKIKERDKRRKAPDKRLGKKRVGPRLTEELLEPRHYWNLTEYPNLIKLSPENVVFISEVSPEGADLIQGGNSVQYGSYFAEYVKFMNSVKKDSDDEDLYQQEWYVQCTEPEYDDKTGQWISRIITCDANGNISDYGYSSSRSKSKKSKKQPDRGEKTTGGSGDVSKKGKKQPEEPEIAKKSDLSEAIKLAELELAKKEKEAYIAKVDAISAALEAYNNKLLTKREFNDLMKKIK